MKPDAIFILNKTKHLLGDRCSHFSIKLIIHLLEHTDTTGKVVIKLSPKLLTRSNENDIPELISVDNHGISFTRIKHSNKTCATYTFKCDDFSCSVEIPFSFEKTNEDHLNENIKKIWEHYVSTIGSDKNIWKRTPTLTTCNQGRYQHLKRFLSQNPDFNVELACSVIDGASRSLYHMGFNPQTGDKLPKRYCDIPNLFINRQRAEELMAKSDADLYHVQLMEVKKKTAKKKDICALKDATTTEVNQLSDDDWLGDY